MLDKFMKNLTAGCVGFLVGMTYTAYRACKVTTFDSDLRKVGIERVVRCNNAYSNLYEIVWIDGGPKQREAAKFILNQITSDKMLSDEVAKEDFRKFMDLKAKKKVSENASLAGAGRDD